MQNWRNSKTGAIHTAHLTGNKTWCGLVIHGKMNPTEGTTTCHSCIDTLKPRTKHTIVAANDPTYELACDIGADLPDAAFWALYDELERLA